ncbi:MAG TPA: AbrB/MazE/SpoVT family DNA-binding domain-containing protein [Gammaproteobacteria bacterium]|nr:AbrB/MazE/SpoVT family DNA-binding domain-containing protein [Gammaproteobacteria bacterium]
MITLNIRKQGGAAVITIPSDILKLLNIEVGDTLTLDVSGKKLVIRPIKEFPKRYSLAELLQGITTKDIKAINEETEWFRDGETVGREII